MKTMLSSRKCHHLTVVGTLLLVVALTGGISGCDGTPSEDLEIRTWHDLDAIRDNLTGSYILMNDLDSATAGYAELASPAANDGMGWLPIGPSETPFTSSFDGQGYEIRDLFINRADEHYVGIFGSLDEGAHIEDIGAVNVTVLGDNYVGSLVGYSRGTVDNSYATGSVNGIGWVGGLFGVSFGTVSNSYFTGNVTCGVGGIGGLAGENRGTVSKSYSTGSVACEWSDVGGLVGQNRDGTVNDSYSTASVSGVETVGGLVGNNVGIVNNCYSTGNVTGGLQVGGLVGVNYYGSVTHSYSISSVNGSSMVGGLVGYNYSGSTVTNSFWDTQTSGQATSAGGTGKTTAEMHDMTTFSGATWNIVGVANLGIRNMSYIWNIVDDETYPFLSWQPVS